MEKQLQLFDGVEERDEKLIALDELFANASAYRRSKDFFELMQFISKFSRYSPYNAFLLHVQNPKVTFVATPNQWKKRFHRRVKPGTKPLLVIAPMHPIMFVYDLEDTEGREIPQGLLNPFETKGELSDAIFDKTIITARKDGIMLDLTDQYSNLHAGTAYRLPSPIKGELDENHIDFYYKIIINYELENKAFYATFVHELGHIYCGHLGKSPGAWWRDRQVAKDIVELEAEAISYLVCKRLGLQTKAEQYLALKAKQDIELPLVSLDTILRVAGKIEKMGKGSQH